MKQLIKTPFSPFITILVFYALVLLWGLSRIIGDEMGYSLLCFYLLAPSVELLCGFSAGKRRSCYKWFFPFTGIFNWLIPFVVFGGRFITVEWISLTLIAVAQAILGLLAGTFYSKEIRRI